MYGTIKTCFVAKGILQNEITDSPLGKKDVQWWTVRSDAGKWGQVPAKFLKVMNGSTEGEVTVHTPIESPDIVVR